MSTYILVSDNMSLDFLIYNIISKKRKFTLKELFNEVSQYRNDITEKDIKQEIKELISQGIVRQHIGYYEMFICGTIHILDANLIWRI